MRLSSCVTLALLALFSANLAIAQGIERDRAVSGRLPVPTDRLVVVLQSGVAPAQFAADYDLALVRSVHGVAGGWLMQSANVLHAQSLERLLRSDSRVRLAGVDHESAFAPTGFAPNDPYFNKNTPSGTWPGQWHLQNQHVPGLDVNIMPAWAANWTGSGVIIGIVDDGLETAHPDLAPGYLAVESWNFETNVPSPNPVYSGDRHGTSVAGVAGARGGNGIGVTGASPLANLSGLRITYTANQTDEMFVNATLYRTNTINIKNHSYGYSQPYADASLERDAASLSGLDGMIHCYSAGNNRGTYAQDANKQEILTSPWTIPVAALGSNGVFASYSSFGANVVCTTPSSSSAALFKITCTDRTTEGFGYNGSGDSFPDPDYTTTFGGTSSAAPLLAGVLGLVEQVRPSGDGRYAKHLLSRTCRVIDALDATPASDGGWKTNAAGFMHNQNYGFGVADATALVNAAQDYEGTTDLQTFDSGLINVNASIPNNIATGISRTVVVNDTAPLEDVLLYVDATHAYRGDIEIFVTSPSGTTSRLAYRSSSDSTDNLDWTYRSVAFWGENPAGTWTIKLVDTASSNTGTWDAFQLTLMMGTLTPSGKPISGNIELQQFVGSVTDRTAEVKVFAPGSTSNPLHQETVILGPNGSFGLSAPIVSGTYDLTIKSSHFLRKRLSNVAINLAGTSGLHASLINGDVDGDNAVGLLDYDAFSLAFDAVLGDAHYSDGADLDGDLTVTLIDYDIFSGSFDLSGDD